MKRFLVLLTITIIIGSGIAVYIKGDDRFPKEFYSPLLVQPLDSVVEKGIEYVYDNKLDSALAYFGVVAGKYNESMQRADKITCAQAYNCKGYVELFGQRQIGTALQSFRKAEQIEKTVGDSTWLPLIYLNMANVYTYTDNYNQVIELNRRASHLALKSNAWRTYLRAFCNLAFQAIIDSDVSAIREDLDKFGSLKIPETNMRGFSHCLYDGGKAMLEKRWDDAYKSFLTADSLNDAELTPDRSHAMSVFLRSRLLQIKGEPTLAIKELLDNYKDFKDDQEASACQLLAKLYDGIGETGKAERFQLRYYEMADSLGLLASVTQLNAAESQFELNNMTMEVARLDAKRNAWITIALVCLLSTLILAAALISVVRSRKRLRKSQDELFLKNKEIISSQTPAPQPATEDEEEARRIMDVLSKSPEIFEVGFSIEKAAMLTGIHSRRISKILNSAYQKNFNTVVQELRIMEACRLLASPSTAGALNMAGIAAKLGFKSRTYFSEVFKKQTGLTPTEYLHSAKRTEK